MDSMDVVKVTKSMVRDLEISKPHFEARDKIYTKIWF